ncbi:uncharacterized protein LOC121262084 [Juglans microcarpa x Juglans regia]|uniref:uncharacterized protein LOC121262084 n=1 Tax=Juglans microcarpa x Juglans regia TaxID=2249226 RepID=UPI001B7F6A5E|nr:uncharacterized protein LOC121262084 [Juglans microcarpa x Juglans regia]
MFDQLPRSASRTLRSNPPSFPLVPILTVEATPPVLPLGSYLKVTPFGDKMLTPPEAMEPRSEETVELISSNVLVPSSVLELTPEPVPPVIAKVTSSPPIFQECPIPQVKTTPLLQEDVVMVEANSSSASPSSGNSSPYFGAAQGESLTQNVEQPSSPPVVPQTFQVEVPLQREEELGLPSIPIEVILLLVCLEPSFSFRKKNLQEPGPGFKELQAKYFEPQA